MPCKIQIKQNITSVIEERTDPVMDAPLETAQAVARGVNSDFEAEVVSFPSKGVRKISIPNSLVDEYYNNELQLEREEAPMGPQEEAMLQLNEMPSSRAAKETLDKMKVAAKQMGLKFEELQDYCLKHPEMEVDGATGVADLAKGTIAIAHGREDVALVEEVVHMGTAMVEQGNPKMMTELISKIGDYKIYKIVFDKYKNNKNYQLTDGKPNIRKIKKEAVDKLIAELIVNKSEGSTEFPELLQQVKRDEVQSWWDRILRFVKDLFGRSDVNLFESVADQIVEGDVGNINDFTLDGTYLQIENRKRNQVVDDAVARYKEEDSKMILHTTPGDRHYTHEGNRVASSVTEKVKKGKPEIKASSPEQQKEWDDMQEWGSHGHAYIEDEIKMNLTDEEGFALAKPLNNPIDSELSKDIKQQLKMFSRKLIKSYPPGTRFIVEKKVINKSVKGMLASTVDFKAFVPIENADGTQDMYVDTLDWKFSNIKEGQEDIPWYKQGDWKDQMGEYVEMDYATYSIQPHQTRLARMVPFIMKYGERIKGDKKSGVVPKAIEIGNLDPKKENNLYLLPVPINTETTGNEEVDNLIQSLQSQWDKLWEKRPADEIERQKKVRDLDELSAAIRQLHLKLDFTPLRDVAKTFLKNSEAFIKDFDKHKLDELNKEELNALAADIFSYINSAVKFSELDKAYLSHLSKENLNKEEAETLATFRIIAGKTDTMLDKLEWFQKQVTMELGVKQGIVSEEHKMSILEAEAAIDSFSGAWKEASKLPSKIINLATDLIMRASEVTKRKTAKQIREFGKLLVPLEKIASQRGTKAFNMIGKMEDGKLSLIKKLSPEFWKNVEKAKEDKNKKFFIDNLNMEEYKKDIEEAIRKGEEDIDKREYDADAETSARLREYAKDRLIDSLDINSAEFNGFESKAFSYYFNKHTKTEGNLSKEYQEMARTPEALAVWEFFTQLNRDARNMGYLGHQGASFFPLIEATAIDKFTQAGNKGAAVKDFFQDFYTMSVNEANQYSMIDPETGKVKKQIPKYFTKTNKTVEQLSTDLNKVAGLWIQSLNEYQNSKDMEFTLLTLEAVEKAKGSLVMENGKVVMSRGRGKVDHSNTTNAQILQTIIDDAIYRLNENLDSSGNINIASITEKFSKDAESKEKNVVAVKKAIKNADTLVQALAVGLKPLIAGANWMGVQFQAYINAGNMYLAKEFRNNNVRVSTGQMNTLERGLLDLIMPLNEDISLEERRKIAKEIGLTKSLSTWSFTDVMMSTNAFPERRLQYANALSFIENSMVVDGKIVNIRQMLRKQDSKAKYEKNEDGTYKMSSIERKALEKSFESRVQALKQSSSLEKVAKIENDKEVVIPGVSEEALADFTLTIKEYMRELNGQMSLDNKAGYRRDTIFSSFMMFKNWIPKLASVRTLDLQKNVQLDEWQYGRARAFLKTAHYLGKNALSGINDIIQGNEKGLKTLEELLEAKKKDYFLKTGQVLEITQEEFNDVMRTQLENQLKELKLALGLLAIVLAAGVAAPPDDASDQEKNLFKWGVKLIHKVSDEVLFFYNPISFEAMTSGRLVPAVGLLSKGLKMFQQLGLEGYGALTGDDEISKEAHGLKYVLNIMPGLAQFQTEVLPYLAPELAKSMGIKVTELARMMH